MSESCLTERLLEGALIGGWSVSIASLAHNNKRETARATHSSYCFITMSSVGILFFSLVKTLSAFNHRQHHHLDNIQLKLNFKLLLLSRHSKLETLDEPDREEQEEK